VNEAGPLTPSLSADKVLLGDHGSEATFRMEPVTARVLRRCECQDLATSPSWYGTAADQGVRRGPPYKLEVIVQLFFGHYTLASHRETVETY